MKKTLALLMLLAGLTMEARAETLIWNGTDGHMTWNTEDSNWLSDTTAAKYANGDTVVFGAAGGGEVSLAGELAPASVLVDTSFYSYTFTGDGKLTGTMQLTLERGRNGTLTINTANNYTGGTLIKGGTLVMGNDNALGTGAVTLGDNATLYLGNRTLTNSVTLQGNAGIGGGTLIGDLAVGEAKTLSVIGDLSGMGTITLGDNATLNLRYGILFKNVTLQGNAGISGGTFVGDLAVSEGKTLSLIGDLRGEGAITLGDNATLHLGDRRLSKGVTLLGSATIGNGEINGNFSVNNDRTLTLSGDLHGAGTITLGGNAKLDLGNHTLSKSVTLQGNASMGNGTLNASVSVSDDQTLTLSGDLSASGTINLGDDSTLNLNKHTLSGSVNLQGYALIGNGTLNGNISVGADKRLRLMGDLSGSGAVNLSSNARLNLGNCTLSKDVALQGNASIGSGTLNASLSMNYGSKLTLLGDLSGTGVVALSEQSKLDFNNHVLSNTISMGVNASIGNGELNGNISVGRASSLTLLGDLSGTGIITIDSATSLNLSQYTLSNAISVQGNAIIRNGELNGNLSVGGGYCLRLFDISSRAGKITLAGNASLELGTCILTKDVTLQGNADIGDGALIGNISVGGGMRLRLNGALSGTGSITLGDNATLDLSHCTLSKDVTLQGNASIGSGTFKGNLAVGAGKTLTLNGDLSGSGKITLGDNATLDLGKHTIANTITIEKSATVRNGTIIAAPAEGNGGGAQPANDTSGAAENSVKMLGTPNLGTLKELAGPESPLTTESLTLTLQNVTIKVSDDIAELMNGLFTIDLDSLVDCNLVLENVLLDASALTLPEDFDPAEDAVAFDFGDDVNILQATGLEMYLGNYRSISANLDEQGKVIFTKLVETPEPTTGTLSLLALAALAARRRRRRNCLARHLSSPRPPSRRVGCGIPWHPAPQRCRK